MRIVVQKFGGTSLATDEGRRQALQKIIKAKSQFDGVVVVVSAMGRAGAPYATDTLLGLLSDQKALVTNRELDMLLSCGEIISSVVIANELNGVGIKAEALSGGLAGIITDKNYSNANVIGVETQEIIKLLKNNEVAVVAGFQGRGTNYEMTTLGRGGSDLTALLLSEALNAEVVEIYTDVNGIMTADPSIYNKAKIIDHISYEDIFQMADSGSKVICKDAVEVARRSGIKVYIKNTFNDYTGTLITWYNQTEKDGKEGLITAIAHKKNRIQFLVEGDLDDERFFKRLADQKISIDIINIFPKRRIFTTEDIKKEEVLKVLESFDVDYSFIDGCSKVTVIGEKMTGVPGVMARIIKALNSEGIELLQTADSLSTIACLIKEEALEKAVCVLHEEFGLS